MRPYNNWNGFYYFSVCCCLLCVEGRPCLCKTRVAFCIIPHRFSCFLFWSILHSFSFTSIFFKMFRYDCVYLSIENKKRKINIVYRLLLLLSIKTFYFLFHELNFTIIFPLTIRKEVRKCSPNSNVTHTKRTYTCNFSLRFRQFTFF